MLKTFFKFQGVSFFKFSNLPETQNSNMPWFEVQYLFLPNSHLFKENKFFRTPPQIKSLVPQIGAFLPQIK